MEPQLLGLQEAEETNIHDLNNSNLQEGDEKRSCGKNNSIPVWYSVILCQSALKWTLKYNLRLRLS